MKTVLCWPALILLILGSAHAAAHEIAVAQRITFEGFAANEVYPAERVLCACQPIISSSRVLRRVRFSTRGSGAVWQNSGWLGRIPRRPGTKSHPIPLLRQTDPLTTLHGHYYRALSLAAWMGDQPCFQWEFLASLPSIRGLHNERMCRYS